MEPKYPEKLLINGTKSHTTMAGGSRRSQRTKHQHRHHMFVLFVRIFVVEAIERASTSPHDEDALVLPIYIFILISYVWSILWLPLERTRQ